MGVHAAGRRLRPLPARRAATRCCYICATDEHGTPAELAAAEAGRAGRRVLRPALARRAEGRSTTASACPSTTSAARSQPAEPRAHPALRRPARTTHGYHRGARDRQVYSPADGRFLPDRYIDRHLPATAATTRARGDQCENCTKLLDPTDLIDPRSAISGSHRPRGPRDQAPLPAPEPDARPRSRRGSTRKTDWPLLVDLDRPQVARDEGLQDRASPATSTGASRSGAAPSPGRGWRARSSTSGSTRRSSTSAPPRSGPTRTASATAAGERWWRDGRGRGRRPLHAVHGQGQRALPHAVASRPPSSASRRAVEARRLHQALQLAELLRRQVLHLARAAASSWTRPWRSCRPTTGAGG